MDGLSLSGLPFEAGRFADFRRVFEIQLIKLLLSHELVSSNVSFVGVHASYKDGVKHNHSWPHKQEHLEDVEQVL